MKEQCAPHVSMREFLRSGQFGPFRLGDSVASLRDAFGEPHDTGGMNDPDRTPSILKYGDIEFHVNADAKHIWLIFCDTFERLSLGPEASFDHWFFEGHPSVESVEQELRKAGLAFHREELPYEPAGFLLRLDSGVELIFSKGSGRHQVPRTPILFGFQYANKNAT